jgi:3,4-dihydroxyphenylacetate 2,3-dioxygenase
MAGGIIASAIVPHTPRMGVEEMAPDFVRPLIQGQRELGEELRALNPDVIVLQSSHWVSTFNWYVTVNKIHEGVCIADEAPDLIPGSPYKYNGDPEFGHAVVDAIKGADLGVGVMDSPHFKWDYASYVPLHYLDPDATVPVVLMPSVICSDLDENLKVGGLVHDAAVKSNKKAIFLGSCALAHKVVRGPHLWPSQEHMDTDEKLISMFCEGEIDALIKWLPDYARDVVTEMGGRPMAGMLGATAAMASANSSGKGVRGKQWGPYGQSSGSGNASICVLPH